MTSQASDVLPCGRNTFVLLDLTFEAAVVDIPGSIRDAQHHRTPRRLISCEPPSEPYHNAEPKSLTARERLRSQQRDCEWHKAIHSAVCDALVAVQSVSSFCFRRALWSDDSSPDEISCPLNDQPWSTVDDLSALLERAVSREASAAASNPLIMSSVGRSHFVINTGDKQDDGWNTLKLVQEPKSDHMIFCVPPKSAFLAGPVEDIMAFHTFIKHSSAAFASTSDLFDVVLLDPPWPNLSAHRKASYGLAQSLGEVQRTLVTIPLSRYLSKDGFVALWITNSSKVREMVFTEDGLFASWGVELIEEWIWVKVTEDGRPVFPLDAVHRKPYEVLLIGKYVPLTAAKSAYKPLSVKRRVLFGVPDLHSRKPCLKYLLEEILLANCQAPRVLEVFARYLVAGWWSWGNEPLRFNWEKCWTETDEEIPRYA